MRIETVFHKSFARMEAFTKDYKHIFITWHWNEFLIGFKGYSTFFHLHLGFLTFGFIWRQYK